ncbi:hypothetical protein [Clostridium sp. 001]|uniref:hypothetical protein n=1 Tax=Clostridium sp. 001 TaxID=1970093 RepID=UPI001C2C6763|nr:hypothetical protein [Clostridium sp. 001]QXE20041.1 hypothetical protein B5S50_15075 [Clostridium sp. 001]
MAKIKKYKINLDTTLIDVNILLKGFRQEINIYTTIAESTEFVDWLNNNKAIQSNKIEDKENFNNKYFIFNDYKKKKTICINRDQIKYFSIPFFTDAGNDEIEFKYLYVK